MSQEKAAEIIDLKASRTAAAAGGGETAGAFLANARRAAGLDLAAVSDATKVKIGHLEAIEASNAAALPATPYAVGFVKVYARFLGLDADALASQFKTDIGADAAPPAEQLGREEGAMSGDLSGGARLASIFGVVAILVFMIWAAVQIAGGGERETRAGEAAANSPRVTLKGEAAPAPQPKPSVAPARDLPTVAVTEGEVAPRAAEIVEPAGEPETPADALETEETAGAAEPAAAVEAPDADAPAGPQSEDASALQAEGAESAAAVSQTESQATEAPPPATTRAPAPRSTPREEPPVPVVVEARLVRSIAPRYPNVCDRGAEDLERVTVIFDITAEGRTANARVLDSTNACFNESALSALGRWRFDPRTVDGAPRPDLGKQATLNFRK